MRLHRLALSNFRQHLETRIDFAPGITGIIGPNGSGKSTLLEAIAWALYGNPAKRGTRESIRSYAAGPRAQVRVELDFELGGHRYLVSRGLNTAEVYLDGSSVPIATSLSAVSDLLERRLGMRHDEFFNTYFSGQKALGVMATMGPTERAQFLSRVLGYERLRTAQDLVRKRRNALDAEIKGLRAGMLDPEQVKSALAAAARRLAGATAGVTAAVGRRDQAAAAAAAIAPQWTRAQQERDAHQALAAELRVAEGEREARQRDRDRIQRELDDIAQARLELARIDLELAPLAALEAELRGLERASSEQARHRTLSESVRLLTEELAALVERRTRIESAPALEQEAAAEATRVRTELEQVQSRFDAANGDWVRDRQEAETKRQALLEQLRDVQQQREQIVNLGENGTCPICARPLGTHFRSVLELLDSQAETITGNGRYYRTRLDQLAAMPPDLAALDEHRRQLPEQLRKLEARLARTQAAAQELVALAGDIPAKEQRRDDLLRELATISVQYDERRHAEVKAALDRLAPLAASNLRLAAQLEREPQLVQEREGVAGTLVAAQARLADLSARRDQLGFSEEAFAAVRQNHERADAALHEAEMAAVAANGELGASRAAAEAAERMRADLERAQTRLAELSGDRRLHDALDRAFGDIRTDLNQELRPEISDRASRYIRELTDGRYTELELDDQYDVLMLEDGIPKPVISGGEEDLANLVLRLAISEMIAERAGQPFSLLILDEVFGSLDDVRRHNVVDLLRRLEDRFEQVILITHIESVREGLDRVITVRYDDDSRSSRLEVEPAAPGAGGGSGDGPELTLELHVGAAD